MSRRRLVMVVAAAFAIIAFSPAAAVASKIDNDTAILYPDGTGSGLTDAWFWFDCGIACGNYWKEVESGDSVSRPGKGGYVQAGGQVPSPQDMSQWKDALVCERGDRVRVGAHGEVGVSYTEPDDPTQKTVTFTWTSKGGNDWTGTIRHKSTHYTRFECWAGTP